MLRNNEIMSSAYERKRKVAGTWVNYAVVTPRFISNKMMKTFPPPSTSPSETQASIATLPHELFYNIVAYIGPTCSSLCSLSQTNRAHNAIMTNIGDVMLPKAKLRFRKPLPPMSKCESSISLFVRHARVSKHVHDKLGLLDEVLNKNFSPSDNPTSTLRMKLPEEISSKEIIEPTVLQHPDIVKPIDVDNALDLALCLLGAGKKHHFEENSEAIKTAESAATTALEWRVTRICGKLGAKAYKYAKTRLYKRNAQESLAFSEYTVTDEMPVDDESDDDDVYIDPGEHEDMQRLNKASLLMQLVVFRSI